MAKYFLNVKNPQGEVSARIVVYNTEAEMQAGLGAAKNAFECNPWFNVVESTDRKLVVDQKNGCGSFEYYITEEESDKDGNKVNFSCVS